VNFRGRRGLALHTGDPCIAYTLLTGIQPRNLLCYNRRRKSGDRYQAALHNLFNRMPLIFVTCSYNCEIDGQNPAQVFVDIGYPSAIAEVSYSTGGDPERACGPGAGSVARAAAAAAPGGPTAHRTRSTAVSPHQAERTAPLVIKVSSGPIRLIGLAVVRGSGSTNVVDNRHGRLMAH
jgi:hypothetical protein